MGKDKKTANLLSKYHKAGGNPQQTKVLLALRNKSVGQALGKNDKKVFSRATTKPSDKGTP